MPPRSDLPEDGPPNPRRRGRLRVFLGLALLAFVALGTWAFWLEPSSLHDEEQRLELPGWPAACAGLRVVVLADLHVGSPYNGLANLERVVDRTHAAAPDLILLAGDFVIHGVVGGRFEPPESAAEVLGRLDAPLGVHAVLGNHDWWLGAERVEAALVGAGISVLEDRAIALEVGDCRFWLAGVSDFWEGPHDVERALRAVPSAAPVVVFTHNPDVFPEIPRRVILTVAGHTHGGQVYLPGIGRPIVPSAYGERFAIGHIVEEGRHLFVSSGVGTSIVPVRFLVPPVVSLLTLEAAPRDEPRDHGAIR